MIFQVDETLYVQDYFLQKIAKSYMEDHIEVVIKPQSYECKGK